MLALLQGRGIHNSLVLKAMREVPRHEFVADIYKGFAYSDQPLPIACHQTISQPYMVALMSQALEVSPGDRVLEIGTGSGYQAAILAHMGMQVFSVERILALYESAQSRLKRLGYNVHLQHSDGHGGWEAHAPYQGIIATCAPTRVPVALCDQLAEGGKLIIPVGPSGGHQTLWCYTKTGGHLHRENLGGVAFVPFLPEVSQR